MLVQLYNLINELRARALEFYCCTTLAVVPEELLYETVKPKQSTLLTVQKISLKKLLYDSKILIPLEILHPKRRFSLIV